MHGPTLHREVLDAHAYSRGLRIKFRWTTVNRGVYSYPEYEHNSLEMLRRESRDEQTVTQTVRGNRAYPRMRRMITWGRQLGFPGTEYGYTGVMRRTLRESPA